MCDCAKCDRCGKFSRILKRYENSNFFACTMCFERIKLEHRVHDILIELLEDEEEVESQMKEIRKWTDKALISYETDMGMLVGWE